MATRPRLSLLVNVVSPYRAPMYRRLAEHFELAIAYSGSERNRDWVATEMDLGRATISRAWGFKVEVPRRREGVVIDHQHVHFNPGYFRHLAKFRPQFLVSNEMGARTLTGLAYSRIAKIPLYVWWGGTLHTESGIGSTRRRVRQLIAEQADGFISYGESSTEYLRGLGVPRSRVIQLQNCVDETRFSPDGEANSFGLPGPRLLYAGQLIPRKGIDLLLRALSRASALGRPASLVIAGDGPERSNLEQLSQSLGVEARVRFVGTLSEDQLAAAYRGTDCAILPTLEDVWGLVVNEALWAGTPVACSNFAGCAAELLDSECIFDPTDDRSFDDILSRACARELPTSTDKLWTVRRAADFMATSLLEASTR